MAASRRSLVRGVAWFLGVTLVLGLGITAWIVVPILTSTPQGSSGQERVVEGFPQSVSATGDDGRTRTLAAQHDGEPERDLSALRVGDRIVVSGSGYNPAQGIYVAVCKVPESRGIKPGPCLGGVPSTEEEGLSSVGAIDYAASNWVNDEWAWRLFGARSFDDRDAGTFTAYIEIPAVADENVDCSRVTCGLYTRNDHTALEDRVQDLYVPVAFAE